MSIADAELIAAVAAQRAAIEDTVAFVHAHPELAHKEHRCAAHLVGRLDDAGLRVEQGVAGLGTGFRAALAGGRAGRRVGIAALYDAVAAVREDGSTEAVHSCGHGLIAGAVVGAALALAPLREQLAGELIVVGCPAPPGAPAASFPASGPTPASRPPSPAPLPPQAAASSPTPPPLPFATDFGSISHRAPAALIGVGRPEGWAFHTDQGAAQFASTAGVDVAADMASVLALATVRLSEPTP